MPQPTPLPFTSQAAEVIQQLQAAGLPIDPVLHLLFSVKDEVTQEHWDALEEQRRLAAVATSG